MNVRPGALHGKAHVIASDAEAIEIATAYADRIRPGASARDSERRRPLAEIEDLRSTGLLGIMVPKAFGGPEVSIRTLVEVFRIVSAADPAIGQIPQNHFSHLENVRALGAPEQQAFFYGGVLAGQLWGNALSERGTPKGGYANMKTRVLQRPNGSFALTGKKFYSTGALFAQWLPVAALDEQGRAYMVMAERHAPGVEIVDDWNSMGQRGTASGTAIFDDVTVTERDLVPIWKYDAGPTTRLAFGQIMHVAVDIGIAQEALADTTAYVRERSRPWYGADLERAGDDPHIIRRVGELFVETEAAHALLLHAADTFDRVLAGPLDEAATIRLAILVAAAKAAASAVCVKVGNDLFALAGTSAADEKWNLHRHWRNARTHTLHDPEVWKYHYIGDFVLNGRTPPRQALIV
ncbi:SfnB family sulfur acquisition oxidoreductase [Mesorhizobium sp. ZC-5]|uniref:SfnB family sulfur acquisition oxidoreductase n=1 Tax=Mesorhizobium sp. ZC-5 TaxID=2986066 RepID=UPI0021E75C14|nr:SfnB family sulfur acquisition oxidoreductase [Mesorhizobium sp. ZC-5]MCV3242878.1 SfnB family sulfur acquisition oxidoreductase [Mesorhizobium sp. ZC-5]